MKCRCLITRSDMLITAVSTLQWQQIGVYYITRVPNNIVLSLLGHITNAARMMCRVCLYAICLFSFSLIVLEIIFLSSQDHSQITLLVDYLTAWRQTFISPDLMHFRADCISLHFQTKTITQLRRVLRVQTKIPQFAIQMEIKAFIIPKNVWGFSSKAGRSRLGLIE